MDSKYLEKAYNDPRQPGAFEGVQTVSKARKKRIPGTLKKYCKG
jgi:hypothetical protein